MGYWIWDYHRAVTTPPGEPRTDDSGVIEQLRNVYQAIDSLPGSDTDRRTSNDVGAYIGVITLAMDRLGPSNHTIHSFEADDLNFEHLNLNTGGHEVVTHNVAVSDVPGTMTFTRNRDHGTNHLGGPSEAEGEAAVVYEVPVDSLDNFGSTNDIQTIDVLKIDVEGSDINVIRGADKLLGAQRIKALIVELPLEEQGRAEMTAVLRAHGYVPAFISRNSTGLVESTEAAYSREIRSPLNMLAVTPDIAELLDFPQS